MFGVSIWRAASTAAALLITLAVSSPMAQAQINRGGTLKCANNLASDVVATAELVWTEGGAPSTTVPVFSCGSGSTQTDNQVVAQPPTATGWMLTISMTSPALAPYSCDTDYGSFTAGDMPHIRLRCVSPTGGAVTFSLSRNP